jgi:hypothetical protein
VFVLFAITVAITAITGEAWKFYFSILVIATIPLFDRWVHVRTQKIAWEAAEANPHDPIVAASLVYRMQRVSIRCNDPGPVASKARHQRTIAGIPGEMIPKFIG